MKSKKVKKNTIIIFTGRETDEFQVKLIKLRTFSGFEKHLKKYGLTWADLHKHGCLNKNQVLYFRKCFKGLENDRKEWHLFSKTGIQWYWITNMGAHIALCNKNNDLKKKCSH